MRESIDGASFAQAMIHAAASLNLQKQQINELNVFPVPDGDTGTNMSLIILFIVKMSFLYITIQYCILKFGCKDTTYFGI